MMFDLKLNGKPVVFVLAIQTEPGEGWRGHKMIGEYDNLDSLNLAIGLLDVPLYWVPMIGIKEAE